MSPVFKTDTLPGRTVEIDGKTCLWFSGTDYLGMAYNPVLLGLLSEGFKKLGSHFGSSRNNTLQLNAFRRAEEALSGYTGADDAILVSSGMLAGFITRSCIKSVLRQSAPGLHIREWEAPMLHPALSRKKKAATDWNSWAEKTAEKVRRTASGVYHIVYSDAIGSPKTARFDFSYFRELPNVLVVVDDSHGIGITGASGGGAYGLLQSCGIDNIMVIASLNKAMGVPGGVILGKSGLLQPIRQCPVYSGASPIPPVYAHALASTIAQGKYLEAYTRLQENNSYFRQQLMTPDRFSSLPAYPVYTSEDPGLFNFLLQNGILSSSFSYPSPHDAPVTRLVISAAHTREDLDFLARTCALYYA